MSEKSMKPETPKKTGLQDMTVKEAWKKYRSAVWAGLIIIALAAGYFFGNQQSVPAPDTSPIGIDTPQQTVMPTATAEEADTTTTRLGNQVSGASGSIGKILEDFQ